MAAYLEVWTAAGQEFVTEVGRAGRDTGAGLTLLTG
jgi:hypothetical protein